MRGYAKTQFRYAMTYIIITFVVLVFLNINCSILCKELFHNSKKAAMTGKTQQIATEIGRLEKLTPELIASATEELNLIPLTRFIITDASGAVIYCSDDSVAAGSMVNNEDIFISLSGNDVFNWHYHNGMMRSEAVIPICHGGAIVGSVYAMEEDTQQGGMIKTLQRTIFLITFSLEIVVIIFSFFFARAFSKRLDKIMASMRILQEGDYTHQVVMNGNDELTVLGEEFNDLTQRLQISENRRRQFVSDASHELKTPLASIKLLSDSILQNDMDIDTIREFVSDIGNEAERLNRMTEKMLALTRGDIDENTSTCTIMPMAPTIARVAKMLSAHAKSSQVSIITDLTNDVPILIQEEDLYQIAFNLAENGIKYNIPGGTLTLSLSRTEDTGILRVTDTGSGIPEDCLNHVFERFYRVDKARSRASGGSGLGLSLVKNMVERNQGTIQVESTFGKGTTFTVEFPAFETEEEQR